MDVHSPADAPAPGILNPPLLRTLVVCDIADSTALVEKLGDPQAAQLVRKHDRLARALLEQHGGREIDKTDGFLLLFERPIHAVAFALDYQRGLKHLSAAEGVVVRARVGIHMGDVVVWENSPEDVVRGAKPIEIEGLAKPMAARLAQLAQPRQILLTAAAASIAHRAHGELGDCAAHVRWRALGRYLFKGLPEAVEVHEVGEESVATFRAPRGSRTAKRILPWWRRPAVLAAEAAMLAVAIAIPAWLSTRSEPALAFAARDWVVVGDLQNLTGNSTFDQSVETALRISLEQSRYVNVLPELKVQETLQRMERDPAKTVVDRGVGSEIALRDGARALVLPTLAEINGKLRVTAEVIDPKSQATVYSVSTDGAGANSVLPSIDRVSNDLRQRLGETLATISKDSRQLDKVATSNLDALRAYSLGVDAESIGKMQEAFGFYGQALTLDPKFALAHAALGRAYMSSGRYSQAKKEIDAAATMRDRLSPRDSLYVDAWLATFDSPRGSIEKWTLLARLYPDFFPASGALAYFSWRDANDFDTAITAAEVSASPRNPHRATSQFLLGALYLGKSRYKDALENFTAAKEAGNSRTDYLATAYAAERNFDEAASSIRASQPFDKPIGDLDFLINRAAIAADAGGWEAAQSLLKNTDRLSPKLSAGDERQLITVGLSLDSISGTKAPSAKELARFYTRVLSSQSSLSNLGYERIQPVFDSAIAAYMLAHQGDLKEAKQILRAIEALELVDDYPMVVNMREVAKAEFLRRSGSPERAIDLIAPLMSGHELYVSHVALMDAYYDAGNREAALQQANWLIAHRGQAYAEYNSHWTLKPFNVVESDLAQLRAAEILHEEGRAAESKRMLSSFLNSWPRASSLAWLASRIAKIQPTNPGKN